MKTQRSTHIFQSSRFILAAGIIGLLQPELAHSASLYWDTTNASDLTSGSATWDVGTTSAWATSAAPGTTAPGTWANGNDAYFQTGGVNTVTIAAGGVSANSVTQATNGTVTTIGGGGLTITGTAGIVNTATSALTINSNVLFSAATPTTFTINTTGSTTVGGSITQGSGAVMLSKTGAGTLTLSGSNSFSGGFRYDSGVVRITHGNALGSGTVTYAGNNARLELSNNITVRNDYSAGTSSTGYTLYSSSGTNTWAGNVVMKSNRIGAGVNGAALVLSGTISGSGNWIFQADDATGVLVVAGTANTYTGILTVQGGVLSANSIGNWGAGPTALGNHADVSNGAIFLGNGGNGGTLRYTGTGETTNRRINMAGTTSAANVVIEQSGSGLLKFTTDFVSTGAATKTLTLQGSTAGIGEIAGAIVDNSATNKTKLTKAGTGKWILSGTSTYTGATTVSSGTLAIDSTGSINSTSGVSIGAGEFKYNSATALSKSITFSGSNGTLSGTGTITPGVTITAGNTLAPGNSIGTLTFGSGLTIAGTYAAQLGTPGSTPANGVSDRAAVTGAITLTGGTLSLSDNAGALTSSGSAGGSMGAGAYQLITYTTTRTGTFASVVNPLSSTLHEKVIYGAASGGGAVDLNLYNIAAANTLSTPVNLGIVHKNQSFTSSALSIQNTAAAGDFTEGLNAVVSGTSGATASGSVSNLAGQATSTNISVSLGASSTVGSKSGTVTVGFASNGTNSGYADTSLGSQVVTVSGQVNEYAQPTFTKTSGYGTLNKLSDTSYTFNLGTFDLATGTYQGTLALNNELLNAIYQDLLSGTFDLTGKGDFVLTGFTNPDQIGIGGSQSLTIGFNTDTVGLSSGTYTGLISLNPLSVNGSGSEALAPISLALEFQVVPEPATWAMMLGGLGMLGFAQRMRRRSAN